MDFRFFYRSFITLDGSSFSDLFGQAVLEQIDSLTPIQVAQSLYQPDVSGPILLSFDLNLSVNQIFLRFNEVVDVVSTLDVKYLTFQNSSGITLSNYTLYTSESSGEVETDFIIELSRFDLNTIKRMTNLLTSKNDTYMSILAQFVSDVFHNPVQTISVSSALLVTDYFPDRIAPQLERFFFNMTQETITLYFSETVQSNSLNTTQLTLLSFPSLFSTKVTLHQTSSLYGDDFIIVFPLDFDDLNLLKRYTDLATSEFDTFISITSSLIRDMNDNYISSINESRALRVDSFYPDLIRPYLIDYSLDLDGSPMISLTFSETVNSDSIDPLQITIQDYHSAQHLRLFNGGYTNSLNNTVIVLFMFKDDIEYIKQNFRLATSINTNRHNTFIRDMNSNYAVPIYDGMKTIIKSSPYKEEVW